MSVSDNIDDTCYKTANQLKYSHFIRSEGSLPYSQQHASFPYPGPDEYSLSFLSCFFKSLFNIIITSPRSSERFVSFRFLHLNYLCIYCHSICATRATHHILFDFITCMIFCEQRKSLCSLLCSFLQSLIISSLLG